MHTNNVTHPFADRACTHHRCNEYVLCNDTLVQCLHSSKLTEQSTTSFPVLPSFVKSATILRSFLNLRRFSTVRKMPFIHRVIPEGSEANFDHLMQGYWKEALDNNVSLLPSFPSIQRSSGVDSHPLLSPHIPRSRLSTSSSLPE